MWSKVGFTSWNLLFSQMGPRWAGSGSEHWGPQPTPWPTAAPGGEKREGGALHRPYCGRLARRCAAACLYLPCLVASKCQMANVHVHSAQCTAAPCSLLLAPSLLNEMVAVRNKPRCKERRPSPERLRPKPKQGAAEMDAQSAKQGAAELLACFFLGPVPVRKEEDALQSARD
jgi:hypothetical protein